MRMFILITSWVLWVLCTVEILGLFILRAVGQPFTRTAFFASTSQYTNLMFSGALIMWVALATLFYLIRQYFWFSRTQKVGGGFWLVTVLFYLITLAVAPTGFLPFFNGNPNALQWVSCSCGSFFLVIGFTKVPPLPGSLEATTPQPKRKPNGHSPRWLLVGVVVSGLIAMITPITMPHILSNVPSEHRTSGASPTKLQIPSQPPDIAFTAPLPSSWTVLERSTVTNEYGNIGSKFVLSNQDKQRFISILVMGKKIPESVQAGYLKSWEQSIKGSLRIAYGDSLVEDSFGFRQFAGRYTAELAAHSATANGPLNFVTRGWIQDGLPVDCQSIGAGIVVTNDEEISNVISSIRLEP